MVASVNQVAWNEMYDRMLFSLMFFSSSFFVVLVTALSFTWVRQELKADREWERLYGKRPAKVQARTTDPQDDRDGVILLRELRSVANSRRDPTVGRRAKRIHCVPVVSEQQRECILKRDGNCKDGSFVISNSTSSPTSTQWIVSVLGGNEVYHHIIDDACDAANGGGQSSLWTASDNTDETRFNITGCDTSFGDLASLVAHFSESGRDTLEYPLRKDMWSDDAIDYTIAMLGSPVQSIQ